ncbi:hypothetical protein FRC04_007090 [Tulasnella sp. 424]|nr:hypothetical protein FRC04_007090 [Tulasnella sp. 424]
MGSAAFKRFILTFIRSCNEYHNRTPVIQKNRSLIWPITEAAIEGIAGAGSHRFDDGVRTDFAMIDITAASISQCVNSRHDMVALLDYMAFQALQVAALIIPPEANPDNDIVHRAVGGAIVPAETVLEIIRRDPNGPRAKKFRATLIIILGGCFCRCTRWDTLEISEDLREDIHAEADRILCDRNYEFNSPLEEQIVLKCAAQLIEFVESLSESPAGRVLAGYAGDKLVLRVRHFFMDESSPNFGTMFPLQVLLHLLLSSDAPITGIAWVQNGVHTAILRRCWIMVRRGCLLSREDMRASELTLSTLMNLYSCCHGQGAMDEIFLKLIAQWDLFSFFALCLLVAERMNEVEDVEKSMAETVKGFNCDPTTLNEVVTPHWFSVLQRLIERERLRPILIDLTAEELKMEAQMKTRYRCKCHPPGCIHGQGFTSPPEVTRTALDAWRNFGSKLGLDEEKLLDRVAAQTRLGDESDNSDEPLTFRGCSWVRCALYGDGSPRKMLCCVNCKQFDQMTNGSSPRTLKGSVLLLKMPKKRLARREA